MSLVFSAIVPHPPLLIPNIGKENLKRLEATKKSYNKLASNLEASGAESILVISPHGIIQTNAFTMNLNPVFTAQFEEFGDFSTKKTWTGDIGLAYKIRERLETKAPLQLISEELIDHGTGIPLILLTEKTPNIKVMPLYYSGLDNEAHFKFGQLLRRELLFNKEKIAVIASGDLSHRITKSAPAGFSPKGKKFDKKLADYLLKNKFEDIVKFSPEDVCEAGECGLRSILILLGILDEVKHEPQLLSYEYPFGVGYLTMEFKL